MKLNQIINDIIDWVRRIVWYREKKVTKQPYVILDIIDGDFGLLKRVDRDTPRAVLTYIFTPYPTIEPNMNKTIKPIYDYHICLDHLWALDNPELHRSFKVSSNKHTFKLTQETKLKNTTYGRNTHRVTILKASRFLDKDGNYFADTLFSNEYDFIGKDQSGMRDKYAVPIIKDVVRYLNHTKIELFDWDIEISYSQKHFMGAKYLAPVVSINKVDDRSI